MVRKMQEKYYKLSVEILHNNVDYLLTVDSIKDKLQKYYKRELFLNLEKPIDFNNYENILINLSKEYLNSLIILDTYGVLESCRNFFIKGNHSKYLGKTVFPTYKDSLIGSSSPMLSWELENFF